MDEHHEDRTSAPYWWHHHGLKMNVGVRLPDAGVLTIGAPAASVRITPVAEKHDDGWYVDWEIRYSRQGEMRGRVVMSTETLKAAFALDPRLDPPEGSLLRYDPSAARLGRFIRKGPYLNIPGPGTGHDGDANVSIYLDETIKEAVRELLAR